MMIHMKRETRRRKIQDMGAGGGLDVGGGKQPERARLRRRRRFPTIFGRGTRTVSVGNPPGNLLIPLFLGPSPEESDNDHGHVVAADASRLRVGGQAVVHHVLADLVQILLGSDSTPDEFDYGLGRLAIPDAL